PSSGWFTSCLFSPDGKTLGTAGTRFNRDWDGTLCVWDVATGKEPRQWKGTVNNCAAAPCSPAGRRPAPGAGARTAPGGDVATGKELHRLEGHDSFVMAVAFSPDGQTLASAGAHSVRLWDVVTGKELRRVESEQHFHAVAFSPHGSTLATGESDGAVRLWDAETGKELRRWEGHRNFLQAVAFA